VKRIAVTGPSGAGKSRLARELGDAFAIQVLHLDTLSWRPGWVKRPKADFEELQRRELEQESWIVDGQPDGMLPDWFDAADTIIFVDASPLQCLWRAGRRRLAGEAGPHVPAGSKPGPLHRSVLKFARWQWHYRWKVRPRLLAELEGRRETQRVVVLRGRTDGWLGPLLSGNPS
jgi:adenylate kinase family enzyme